MVLDGHSDLLFDVTRRRLAGETRVLERRHLERLRRGGVEGMVLSIWADPEDGASYRRRTEEIFACSRAELAECPWLEIVRTAAGAEAAKAAGKLYAFIGVEGMAAVGQDLDYIGRYAEFGARMGMLTWNEENSLATGAKGDPQKGLTEQGKQAVRRMESLGMTVDVSHLNDGGFWDVMRLTHGPVIASHSNCRALCDVRRNLSDEQLRAIRDTGGIVGVNVYHSFVHAEPEKQTVETLAQHACHMAEVMGVEHVACGFDFCEYFGPGNDSAVGMDDCSKTDNFFHWLEKLGMDEGERRMIARENLLRLLA